MNQSPGIKLFGFADSVYCWAVRIALAEKNGTYDWIEVDPFSPKGAAELRAHHPFGRVPVLKHDEFSLFQTAAILDYLDTVLPGQSLTPGDAQARARMVQVISVLNGYGFHPLVRQVFSHGVYRPLCGEPSQAAQIAEGLVASGPVLDALADIAPRGAVGQGVQMTQADCLLAPMLLYFAALPEGAAQIAARPPLRRWLDRLAARDSVQSTRPPVLLRAAQSHTGEEI